MNIGFIGLGIMGSRMAANLQKAGYTLTVHNRTRSKADDLLAGGATWAETPAAVATDSDILITMLATPQAISELALGDDGFLARMRPGTLWLNTVTVHPTFARQMDATARQHNVRYLDAPVGGTKTPAADGQLVFLVGGDAHDVDDARPLLEVMGRAVIHAGPAGMGTAMKLLFNNLLATSMAAFVETLTFGEALGFDRQQVLDMLIGTAILPPYMAAKKDMLATREFVAHFPLRWMQKDTQMVSIAAYEVEAPMPVSNVTKEVFMQAVQQGWGDHDFAALYELFAPHSD